MINFTHDFSLEQTQANQKSMEDAFNAILKEHRSKEIGYYDLPKGSVSLVNEAQELLKSNPLFSSEAIKDIAIIGIGGSSLGIKAIDSMMSSKNTRKRKLHFFENSDPTNISKTLSKLKKESTVFIVISKSGSTIETTSIFKTVLSHFQIELGAEDKNHLIAITDSGSSLSKFADHYGITEFNIPANVGGRFSVLSAVGIIPLTLAGYNTKSLLHGADKFLTDFFNKKEEHLLKKACYLYENSSTQDINILFSYANDLENFGKWYVQLWGESLGKIDIFNNPVGLTPIGLIGSIDQHSFLQLLIEGPKDKTVTFINVKDFEDELSIPDISLKHIEQTDFINTKSFNTLINAQCEATKESLIQNNIAVDAITIDKIDEENIGTIIIYYELLTSLLGAMFKINTYNQPGVELGKQILYKKFNNKTN